MRKQLIVSMVGAMVLALLIAGCGGGDDGGGSGGDGETSATAKATSTSATTEAASTPATTKAAFIKQANVICAAHKVKMLAGIVRIFNSLEARKADASETHKGEVTLLVPMLASNVIAEMKEIRALGAPSGEEDRVNAVLDAFQAWVSEAEANPEKIIKANNIFDEAREQANQFPLANCAESPFQT